MECLTLEDNGDPKRSDKYSIYLAAVEPNLREAAKEIMAQEAELPPEEPGAEGGAGHREYV